MPNGRAGSALESLQVELEDTMGSDGGSPVGRHTANIGIYEQTEERDMNFVTPAGFRDVLSDEARVREEMTRSVQRCFDERGYVPIETPTLEVMDVLLSLIHI